MHLFGPSAFICVDVLPFVSHSCMHICTYSYASFPFYCGHTYVHVVMHSYIFPLLFTALFKLGLHFNFALKRNCCVVESVHRSCDHKDDVDNDDCDRMRAQM